MNLCWQPRLLRIMTVSKRVPRRRCSAKTRAALTCHHFPKVLKRAKLSSNPTWPRSNRDREMPHSRTCWLLSRKTSAAKICNTSQIKAAYCTSQIQTLHSMWSISQQPWPSWMPKSAVLDTKVCVKEWQISIRDMGPWPGDLKPINHPILCALMKMEQIQRHIVPNQEIY